MALLMVLSAVGFPAAAQAASGLMSLKVTGVELAPKFAPDVTNYALYCTQDQVNKFTLTATVPSSVSLSVNGASKSSGEEIPVVADANDLVEIKVQSSGRATSYWLRCLPPRFPHITFTRYGKTSPGWYLMNGATPFAQSQKASGGIDPSQVIGYAMIVDENGVPVWYRSHSKFEDTKLSPHLNGLQLLSDGTLTWFPDDNFPFGIKKNAFFERINLNGKVLAKYSTSAGFPTNHHDLKELPDGGFLIASMPLETLPKQTKCWKQNVTSQTEFTEVVATKVASAHFERLDATGKTVWTWDADIQGKLNKPADERIRFDENVVPVCWAAANGEVYLSAVHPNSIDVVGDLLVFSARNNDAVYGINMKSNKVVFKFGGTNRPDASFRFLGKTDELMHRQHDVRLDSSGRLTMLDNRSELSFAKGAQVTGPARFAEYQVNFAAKTVTPVRFINNPRGSFSAAMGSARVQSDGAVVVGWGNAGALTATEFNFSGKAMLDIEMQQPPYSYRVLKVDRDRLDLGKMRTAVGENRAIVGGSHSKLLIIPVVAMVLLLSCIAVFIYRRRY